MKLTRQQLTMFDLVLEQVQEDFRRGITLKEKEEIKFNFLDDLGNDNFIILVDKIKNFLGD